MKKKSPGLASLGPSAPTDKNEGGPADFTPRQNLKPFEKKRLEALMQALTDGKFDMKSSLGNRFRELYPNIKVKGLAPGKAEEFKMKFVHEEMGPLVVHKKQVTKFEKIDFSKVKMRTFGKLVMDMGGWSCADAIAGAACGASKCLVMGPPWWRIHPQTERMEFAIMETGWETLFKNAWEETKEEINGDGPKALMDGTAGGEKGVGQTLPALMDGTAGGENNDEKGKNRKRREKTKATQQVRDPRGEKESKTGGEKEASRGISLANLYGNHRSEIIVSFGEPAAVSYFRIRCSANGQLYPILAYDE